MDERLASEGHGVQGVDGDKGGVGGVAQSFGGAYTYAQACVRAGAHAHRHSIELVKTDTRFLHHRVDEEGELLGMVLSLGFFLALQNIPIVNQSHRT